MDARTRWIEYLPAVFRQDEVGGVNFLGRFLDAFESVFDELQDELEAIPDLFALPPTPALAVEARAGTKRLQLDSAAGLCPGDVLHLRDADAARIEFVEVMAVSANLLPTTLDLSRGLRFDHNHGTPMRLVGRPGPAVPLSQDAGAGTEVLTVLDRPALGASPGDVVRIDDGGAAEFGQVVLVQRSPIRITVTPALQRRHAVGQPVVRMQAASQTTPPIAFAHAIRSGPELVLRAAALAGEAALELDTITALAEGDVLHVRDPDPSRVEFVQVQAMPSAAGGPGVLRFAVQLSSRLRFGHDAGTDLGVMGAPAGATELLQRVERGAGVLMLRDPESLGIAEGDVLQVGQADATEYVQVLASSGQTITVTPSLQQDHNPGQRVVRIDPSGSGLDFLRWLAGWLGLDLRPTHGERWNRELVRLAGRLWPWRGTQAGVEAFLNVLLRDEAQATLFDPSNPLQIGLTSTVGVDTVICGGLPHFFWVDLLTEARNSRLYHPVGLNKMLQAVHQALHRERPAHTDYDLRLQAHTMQIESDVDTAVGARVGATTLLWEMPLIIPGNR
jgi:hypothetical protein